MLIWLSKKTLKIQLCFKRRKVLKVRKHGGDRGDRHDLCRSPTIVLYWLLKVQTGTAGTGYNFIIINRIQESGPRSAVSTDHQTKTDQKEHLHHIFILDCLASFVLLGLLFCFALYGGGGGNVFRTYIQYLTSYITFSSRDHTHHSVLFFRECVDQNNVTACIAKYTHSLCR
jgi:hypothetical protein